MSLYQIIVMPLTATLIPEHSHVRRPLTATLIPEHSHVRQPLTATLITKTLTSQAPHCYSSTWHCRDFRREKKNLCGGRGKIK